MVTLARIQHAGVPSMVGIDPHLGQKPKLGGRYADRSLIYISYLIGHLYIHLFAFFSFRFLAFSLSFLFSFAFQNTKSPKIFPLFLSICFFGFSAFGLPYLLVASFYLKTQKDFDLFATFVGSCFKSKTQKYLLFFFGVVKFAAEFNSLLWFYWSWIIISNIQSTQVKSNNDDLR